MTEEEIIHKNYDAEQCSRRRWNEAEQKWERAFDEFSTYALRRNDN